MVGLEKIMMSLHEFSVFRSIVAVGIVLASQRLSNC